MSNVGQDRPIWVPTRQMEARIRPFAQLGKRLRDMGFEAGLRHDPRERVVEVRFTPTTDRTRQAVKVAAESSQATALDVKASYGVLDDKVQVVIACLEKGIEEIEQAL